MNFSKLTALELGKKIKNKEALVIEVTKAQIDYIKANDINYNCFITKLEEEAIDRAHEVQQMIDRGDLEDSPLAGVPMAIKDNICTKDIKTSCASKMLADFVPSYNATVVERLNKAGAILLGKTNLDEFAMGISSETSYFGTSKNPANIEYVPGGSSGGSAAAVASNEAFYTLGTDTGGSIRQPSGYCGVTGIKPTYGTVSRYGLVPFASSLDQIGPITKDVSDSAAVLDIIKGYDPKDSTSVDVKSESYTDALINDVKGMRIAVPKEFLTVSMNEQVRKKLREAIDILKDKGGIIDYIDFETMEYVIPTYYILSSAEASSSLSRYDGIKYGHISPDANNLEDIYRKSRGEAFGKEVKFRILLGNYVLSADNYEAYYKKALKTRMLINSEFDKVFCKYDIILLPTNIYTAFKFKKYENDFLQKHKKTDNKYTIAANLIGAPAISIPYGLDNEGLPIGLQIIGKRFAEREIIRAAYSAELR